MTVDEIFSVVSEIYRNSEEVNKRKLVKMIEASTHGNLSPQRRYIRLV